VLESPFSSSALLLSSLLLHLTRPSMHMRPVFSTVCTQATITAKVGEKEWQTCTKTIDSDAKDRRITCTANVACKCPTVECTCPTCDKNTCQQKSKVCKRVKGAKNAFGLADDCDAELDDLKNSRPLTDTEEFVLSGTCTAKMAADLNVFRGNGLQGADNKSKRVSKKGKTKGARGVFLEGRARGDKVKIKPEHVGIHGSLETNLGKLGRGPETPVMLVKVRVRPTSTTPPPCSVAASSTPLAALHILARRAHSNRHITRCGPRRNEAPRGGIRRMVRRHVRGCAHITQAHSVQQQLILLFHVVLPKLCAQCKRKKPYGLSGADICNEADIDTRSTWRPRRAVPVHRAVHK